MEYGSGETQQGPVAANDNIKQEAPAEDGEMRIVREVFEKASNAIVDASRLKIEVSHLRAAVEGLRSEVEKVRSQNQWLDEQLTNVRSQRDKATGELNEATRALAAAQDNIRVREDHIAHQREELARLTSSNQSLISERDEAQFEALALKEENEKLIAQLDKIKAVVSGFAEAMERAQPRTETGQWASPKAVTPAPIPDQTPQPIREDSNRHDEPGYDQWPSDAPKTSTGW